LERVGLRQTQTQSPGFLGLHHHLPSFQRQAVEAAQASVRPPLVTVKQAVQVAVETPA
jgi:hypothetical protein